MSVGGIYGFVLQQCRFGSDYRSWKLDSQSLQVRGFRKFTQTSPALHKVLFLCLQALILTPVPPLHTKEQIFLLWKEEGAASGHCKQQTSSATEQRYPRNPGQSCLVLYLQYLVPHSECSLQLAPKGFMLFQRHSIERLVLCSRPPKSSQSGSEATCGGGGRWRQQRGANAVGAEDTWTAQMSDRSSETRTIRSWRVLMVFPNLERVACRGWDAHAWFIY